MEKNLEDSSAVICLSQSYNDGIQKIVGTEQAIPLDFEVPQHILERRKASWNGLFQKYSTMVSEVAFNIRTMKPEEVEDMQEVVEEPIEPRMPMRKSMSMVQYWVDTGNQPYIENFNNRTHSDSGSSLAEEEIVELDEAAFSPSAIVNSSLVKQSEAVGVSNSKLMRIASSSSSSVDTAAYILANNNTTKQAETLAIVEGSKVDKKQNNLLQPFNLVNSVNSINTSGKKIEMYQKHFLSKNTVKRRDNTLKVNHLKENVNKTNDDDQEFDLDATKIVSEDSNREQVNGLPSILVSESDESVIKSRLSTGVQRKKLYKNTESPAEFTPASEAASSHKAPRLSMKPCEHPAFQTPKLSRPSYLVKRTRQRFRKKKNRNLLSLKMSLSKTDENKSPIKDDNTTQSNISEKSKTKNSKEKSKTSFHNLKTNPNKPDKNLICNSLDNNSNDSRLVQQPLDRRKNSDLKKSLDHNKRFNLKTVYLTLHRLPYIYGNIKTYSDDAKSSTNGILRQKEEKRLSSITQNQTKELNIAFSDDELSNNSYRKLTESQKRYTQSPNQQTTPKSTRKGNSKTKIEKVLASKENKNNGESIINNTSPADSKKSNSVLERVKIVETTNNNVLNRSQNKSPVVKSNKDKNKIVYDKSVKYVLVLSSSDESESIIPVSSKKLRKRSLKRKTNTDEKFDDNSEHEAKKLLLSSNRKNSSKLKSTELKSQESEEANVSNSTINQQTISSFADNEKISPVKKKLVNSKSKTTNNKDKASAVFPRVKKNVQRITDVLSNEKEQVSAEIESQNKNENEAISTKLINKPVKRIYKTSNLNDLVEKVKSKSNNDKNSRDSLLTKKQENDSTQSNKSFGEEKNYLAKKIKLTPDTKSKHSVENKEAILDCQDLRESNSNTITKRKSKRDTTKEKKFSVTNKSKRKTDEILILSDDECIIPLKMKAQGE